MSNRRKQMERNYVIVCNEHQGIAGSLLFWGYKTKDNEERSFGGYTSDFDDCEKYTLEEIMNSDYKNIPIYGKLIKHDNWRKVDDFVIDINRLKVLGYRKMTIWYR